MLGQGGHQRGGRGVGVLPAEQVDGAPAGENLPDVGPRSPGAGDAPLAHRFLEEQRQCLLHGGDGVAGGPFVSVEGPVQQSVPEPGGLGVGAQDL
ncbi:hypothetical protein [Ornithinimicrobium kibberense]|uniref:hypothetical protein n=1 Tax=Ornithinimicrobium kibberense TaxID=282060 RepID=UPI0036184D2E